MTRIHKLAACFLIGALVFTGKETITHAAVDSLAETAGGEPVAGIVLTLDEIYQNTDNADKAITKCLTTTPSEYDNLAFAKVSNYVNIRSEANEDSEILGKLYDNSAARIITEKDGWYQITSGSVKGYIKDDFLVTGNEAVKLTKTLGRKMATVTTTTLKVRDKASLDAAVLTLIPEGDEFRIVKEQEGWIKVALGDNQFGYVSADYVKIQMEFEEAVSIQEEKERLQEEDEAASQSVSEGHHSTSSVRSSSKDESSDSGNNQSDSSGSSSLSLGSRIASYAVQFVGNPYVWGGTSLTNGADCSGFTQSVFAHFGIGISRTSRTQAGGGPRISMDNLRPGDLIFYTNGGTINHVAIYIGGGKVISASSPSTGIRITNYNYRQPYKAVRYTN